MFLLNGMIILHPKAVISFFLSVGLGQVACLDPVFQVPFSQLTCCSIPVANLLLFYGVPEREAAMWGFLKATPLTEAIMVLPEVTPVASKFSLPTEMVTVNKHCFSPPTWSEGIGGLPSLSTYPVVGTT